MDLDEAIAARRGRMLLDLIDMLQSTSGSRLREAFLNDPEQAALMADLPESDEAWAPRVSEWDLHAALMYDQRHILTALLAQLQTMATRKKAKVIPPLPGPKTALQDAREAKRIQVANEVRYAFGWRPPV